MERFLFYNFMLKLLVCTPYRRQLNVLGLWLIMTIPLLGQSRQEINFNAGWRFTLDSVGQHSQDSGGDNWRLLDLPHDWSIEMPFREHSPAGSGGAYLDGGIGWYQKSFKLPRPIKVSGYLLPLRAYMKTARSGSMVICWENGQTVISALNMNYRIIYMRTAAKIYWLLKSTTIGSPTHVSIRVRASIVMLN
ncbi:hypothetical protein KUH03_40125 [Sphingobacterium sp. E70]|nr:hypothetical protein [Sphingobacterium sp. E70]ULT25008.1 hypothetical protein KUH03_40125 [Sphingobacterium sp. E70]